LASYIQNTGGFNVPMVANNNYIWGAGAHQQAVANPPVWLR